MLHFPLPAFSSTYIFRELQLRTYFLHFPSPAFSITCTFSLLLLCVCVWCINVTFIYAVTSHKPSAFKSPLVTCIHSYVNAICIQCLFIYKAECSLSPGFSQLSQSTGHVHNSLQSALATQICLLPHNIAWCQLQNRWTVHMAASLKFSYLFWGKIFLSGFRCLWYFF